MSLWKVFGLLAVVAISTETGRVCLNKLFKRVMHIGQLVKDSAYDLTDKAQEYKQDLLSEINGEEEESKATAH
ncbi:MAG: hypothetical protein K2W82_10030 [Candidatus Obscuribacterales bacterium]|nr:hypothetical protein [Candidatus Obscuribacterales bacterium]